MTARPALLLALKTISVTLLVACGAIPNTKSPQFTPETVVKISGQYLNDNGDPMRDTSIFFQNLRRFGYIDSVAAAQEQALNAFGAALLLSAFPMFIFYDNLLGNDPFQTDPSTYTRKPNYKLANIRTDADGKFLFQIQANTLLRDADGGINIVIVNEKPSTPAFGKYAFVVKSADTDLGTLRLCTLGGLALTENPADDSVTFSWSAPQYPIQQYVLRFGSPSTGNVLWTESFPGNTTSATFPRALFYNQNVRLAIEGFYTFENEKKVSCLTPPKDFTVNSTQSSLATGSLAKTDAIKFKIHSLTNGKFDDNIYLGAFDVTELTLDFNQAKTFQKIALFNLKLKTAGTVGFSISNDGVTFTSLETVEARRFQLHTLASPVGARYLRLKFAARVVDLQEIALF